MPTRYVAEFDLSSFVDMAVTEILEHVACELAHFSFR